MPAKPASSSNPLQSLTKKAGPLPVWAWAAIILLGFYLYSHRSGSNIAAPTSSTSPAVNTGTGTGAGDGTGTPPDLTSQLSGLGTSLSDIAANQSALAGYNDQLLAGQQAIWDSLGMLTTPVQTTPYYVGGGANGSGTYNTSWNSPTLPVVRGASTGGGFLGPNPSPTGFSPPDAVVGNSTFGGQYASPQGNAKAKLA